MTTPQDKRANIVMVQVCNRMMEIVEMIGELEKRGVCLECAESLYDVVEDVHDEVSGWFLQRDDADGGDQ